RHTPPGPLGDGARGGPRGLARGGSGACSVSIRRSKEASRMSEMRVVGVRVELPANQPILLLREAEGDRYLPIWIGSVEATAIALEQQGVKPARPLTHDLLKDVV